MIYFVVRDVAGRYAITLFLAGWGRRLTPEVRVLDYDTLFRRKRLRVGTYIFSDLDYVRGEAITSATGCWDAVSSGGGRGMNHPSRALRRYDLLRRLHESGVNDFNVHRLDHDRSGIRFPVFLRGANDHEGPRTDLIATAAELEAAIKREENAGVDVRDWIVTEFSECRASDGLYRKYGAFNVGGQIIPRHLIFSHDWMVKSASRSLAGPTMEEERKYVETNPHEAQLRDIFAAAQIEYGRIDYAVHDGRIRAFEINTNPQIVTPGQSRDAARSQIKITFAERLVAALEKCNTTVRSEANVPIDVRCASVREGAVSWVERAISATNAVGLEQFEPRIFRRLFAVRAFWRNHKNTVWAHTPLRLRQAIRALRDQ